MGDQTERELTTRQATEKLNQLLNYNQDYNSAILLASIYVNMRLRTLITHRLNPTAENFKDISNALDNQLGYKKLITICEKLDFIDRDERKGLKDLYDKRCEVAHKTDLWKDVSDKDKEEVKQYCNLAITFLNKTTNLPITNNRHIE